MAYSQALVIAGGLAHIPVVTGIFWFFDKSNNPKQSTPKKITQSTSKPKIASSTEDPTKAKPLPEIQTTEKPLAPEETIDKDKTIENTLKNVEIDKDSEQQ